MLWENISLAMTSLLANKVRMFLTMLGIIIGIASVVAIMTVSDAMNNSVLHSMGNMGANDINVYLMQNSDSANVRSMKNSDYISNEMLEDLSNQYGDQIEGIACSQNLGDYKVEEKKAYANIGLKGVNDEEVKTKKLNIIAGRTFDSLDFQSGRKIVLVSDKYVENMFAGDNQAAVGKTVEVIIGNKYYSYTIVGVYKYDSGSDERDSITSEKDIETDCFLPLSTAMKQSMKTNLFEECTVVALNGVDSGTLAENIANYLNQRYYKENDAYAITAFSMESEIQYMKEMIRTQKMAFLSVGALALFVGGIGVMNIMIVSIKERTREIGTRKALGATNGYIRLQFITEAVVMCTIGGIVGIMVGCFSGALIAKVLGYSGSPSLMGVILSFMISLTFGIFFGFYPANKAAQLNPIEALRYE